MEYLVGDSPVKWNPELATLKESSENVSHGFEEWVGGKEGGRAGGVGR